MSHRANTINTGFCFWHSLSGTNTDTNADTSTGTDANTSTGTGADTVTATSTDCHNG